MTYNCKTTALASMAALAMGAILAFAPMKTEAATCNPGTCIVSGSDGQNLTDAVTFGIFDIKNGLDGFFTFSADFFNDTTVNGSAMTTVLQFEPTGLASINNLVFSVTSPGIVAQSFQITNANGEGVNQLGSDVVVTLDLIAAPNQTIGFEFTGEANPVNGTGSGPGIQVAISAVPLPASALLLLGGLGGLGGLSALRRRKRAA